MFTVFIQALQRVPSPIAGLALGLASLGLCLESRFPTGGILQASAAIMAASLLSLLVGKFILNPQQLWDDISHAVIGSVLPTFAMALMVISKWAGLHLPQTGIALWYLGIALHLVLLIGFIYHRLGQRHWHFMVPSWFVPPVGIIVAAVTCPGPEQQALAQLLVMFGLSNYLLMLAPMLYRLIFHPELPDKAKPTIAILAAPASLSLAGYLNISDEPSTLVVALMLGIAMTMTALVYIAFFRLLRLPFSPGYAAFTFPMVIGASAMYRCSALFEHWQLQESWILYRLADIELAIACVVVGYVTLHYIYALFFNMEYKLLKADDNDIVGEQA